MIMSLCYIEIHLWLQFGQWQTFWSKFRLALMSFFITRSEVQLQNTFELILVLMRSTPILTFGIPFLLQSSCILQIFNFVFSLMKFLPTIEFCATCRYCRWLKLIICGFVDEGKSIVKYVHYGYLTIYVATFTDAPQAKCNVPIKFALFVYAVISL